MEPLVTREVNYTRDSTFNVSRPRTVHLYPSLTFIAQAELDSFHRLTGLAMPGNSGFSLTTSAQVQVVVGNIQTEQERRGTLMYMRRFEPFLISMQQFSKTAEEADAFVDLPLAMGYIWVGAHSLNIVSSPPISRAVGANASGPSGTSEIHPPGQSAS